MSFGTLAPFYWALERLVFGDALQRARISMFSELRSPKRALIAGEGDGRFLAEFVRRYPECEVTCVDGSARMLALARRRVDSAHSSVHFLHADLVESLPVTDAYDLVVTHFFLDCFDSAELSLVVNRIAGVAHPNAQWLLADFTTPAGGIARSFARAVIAAMYAFFRLTTSIGTTRLIDPAPSLSANGFTLVTRELSVGGIVKSDLWQRG